MTEADVERLARAYYAAECAYHGDQGWPIANWQGLDPSAQEAVVVGVHAVLADLAAGADVEGAMVLVERYAEAYFDLRVRAPDTLDFRWRGQQKLGADAMVRAALVKLAAAGVLAGTGGGS